MDQQEARRVLRQMLQSTVVRDSHTFNFRCITFRQETAEKFRQVVKTLAGWIPAGYDKEYYDYPTNQYPSGRRTYEVWGCIPECGQVGVKGWVPLSHAPATTKFASNDDQNLTTHARIGALQARIGRLRAKQGLANGSKRAAITREITRLQGNLERQRDILNKLAWNKIGGQA